jgi:hypothetical protein
MYCRTQLRRLIVLQFELQRFVVLRFEPQRFVVERLGPHVSASILLARPFCRSDIRGSLNQHLNSSDSPKRSSSYQLDYVNN